MKERLILWFPFVLAVLVPLAGFVYGVVQYSAGERNTGVRLIALSLIASVIWVLVFVG